MDRHKDLNIDEFLKDWSKTFNDGNPGKREVDKFLNKYPMKFKCNGCGAITVIKKMDDWQNCECGSTGFEMV